MKKIAIIVSLLGLLFSPRIVFGNLIDEDYNTYTRDNTFNPNVKPNFDTRHFQSVVSIPDLDIEFPTIVEIPLTVQETVYNKAAVLETTTGDYQPYQITSITQPIPYTVTNIDNSQSLPALSDNNSTTFIDFAPSSSSQSIQVELDYKEFITTNSLRVSLAPQVSTPEYITIQTTQPNEFKTIVNREIFPASGIIYFPTSSAANWIIKIEHSQLLRISDIHFETKSNTGQTRTGLTFLARPNQKYQVYVNADQSIYDPYLNAGNYSGATNRLNFENLTRLPDPSYLPADRDNDSIPDTRDNCPSTANKNQLDANHDNQGDACQDFDFDGLLNLQDNCPSHPNPRQQDTDHDGIGDHCDESESRLTEQYAWLPWLGLSFGFLVVIILLTTTVKKHQSTSKKSTTLDLDRPSQPPIDSPPKKN